MKKRHLHAEAGLKIREVILGMQDGVVSNLGVVLGVSYGVGDPRVALIAGVAAVFAEGMSMMFSQYSASRSLQQFIEHQIKLEKEEIKKTPEVEREEIREIYRKKGFKGEQLEEIVEVITSNKKVWLDTLKNEELRWLPLDGSTPLKDGLVVGVASTLAGLFPVWPFAFFPLSLAIPVSIASAGGLLFVSGALQTRLTGGSWFRSGIELLLIGALAALVGYAVGTALHIPAL